MENLVACNQYHWSPPLNTQKNRLGKVKMETFTAQFSLALLFPVLLSE